MIPILRLLRAAAGSDRDLLDRYVRNRDEEAFEALVRRYGTGVWAACVRLAVTTMRDSVGRCTACSTTSVTTRATSASGLSIAPVSGFGIPTPPST